ncbi:SMC-Scp complex subunit ScpB [Saccharibacillus alkalitolerans]|uniref:Segregation and condensation protein B n=1 Tax=Saccharibacillus alkalitolerans TaxID=2705290 RepID=A0ABX0F870_9BACL|nr:SMC-Scp complex subunit ScpB [Saccharibacillus alkalitolerans]NGZ74217.1 SMC-Scp complex subunit ScpB [Saccharibacillus alkalitolerans]
MDLQTLKSIIEGLLFLAGDEGLTVRQVAEITECKPGEAQKAVESLQRDLRKSGRGVRVTKLAGAYHLATLPEHSEYYERLAYSPSRATLSQAALETLAIVAYRQPITRIEIEEIRGVKSERAIHTLTNKNLIVETGRADAIGRPILYGTTKAFLDYFGLGGLEELPDASAFEAMIASEEEDRLLFGASESSADEESEGLPDESWSEESPEAGPGDESR